MKFNAALVAAVAATAHGAAVDADDFSGLDAFVSNIPTDALRAAQSSIAAGIQPTPDATTAVTPAESSQVAAIANADDGLPSEDEIDKLIASADAKFGTPDDNKGLPAPPATAAARAQATPHESDQATPEILEAIKGGVAFAKAAAAASTAPGIGSATATGGAATATGLVVDNSGNGTANPNQVWTAAAAPRQAVGALAVAGMIAAYFV